MWRTEIALKLQVAVNMYKVYTCIHAYAPATEVRYSTCLSTIHYLAVKKVPELAVQRTTLLECRPTTITKCPKAPWLLALTSYPLSDLDPDKLE